MTILKDYHYADTKIELEFSLYRAPEYNERVKWVGVKLVLRFGDEYPQLVFTSECQELLHIEKFVSDMQQLSAGKVKRISLIPWDPNFVLFIKIADGQTGRIKEYEVLCKLDVSGMRGKEYYAVGPALHMTVSNKELEDFSKALIKKLKQFSDIEKK